MRVVKAPPRVKTPPRIKASKNTTALSAQKPQCRIHHRDMFFNPTSVRWECGVDNCESAAYPKTEEVGRPIMGKGRIEFLIHTDEDGKTYHYLRTVENNVMILLTDDVIVKTNVAPMTGTAQNAAKVTLFLKDVTVMDEYGKREKK